MPPPPVDRLASPASPGLRVDDYALVARRFGHGLGDAWVGERPDGSAAAVKFLGPAEGATAPRAFDDHLKKLARVTSPNLAALRGGGVSQGWLYVVTELVEARTLGDWLAGQRETGAPTPAGVALHLFDGLCGALQGAHRQGVAHGAVGPATVLLRALAPGAYHTWVLDLGLGRWVRDASLVAAVEPPSAVYLAPEQDAGGDGTARSDVFSLALLLVELLCGTATPGCTPRETFARAVARVHRGLPAQLKALRGDVHDDFWTTLASALHPDPAQRPESAQQLKARVRAAAQNAGLWRDTPEPAPEPPTPRAEGTTSGPASGAKGRDGSVPEGWQHSERIRVDPAAVRAVMARSVRPPRASTVPPPEPAPPVASAPPVTHAVPAAPVPPVAPPVAAVSPPPADRTDPSISLPNATASFADEPDDALGTVRRPSLAESVKPAPSRPPPAAGRLRAQTRAIQDEERSAFQTLPASRGFGDVAPIDAHPGATMKVMRGSVPGLPTAIPDDLEDTTMSDPSPSPSPSFAPPVESTVALYAPPAGYGPPTPSRPMTMPPASYAPPAPVRVNPQAPPDATLRAPLAAPQGAAPFVLRPPDALPAERKSRWWVIPAVVAAALVVAAVAWFVALPGGG